jgi:hypothetical protein
LVCFALFGDVAYGEGEQPAKVARAGPMFLSSDAAPSNLISGC